MNVSKIDATAQADRELDYSERIARNVVEVDPWRPASKTRSPEIVALGLVIGGGWLGLLCILGGVRSVLCWGWEGCAASPEAQLVNGLLWLWLALPVLGAVAGSAVVGWGLMIRMRAEAARMSVTRDRYGNPVSAHAVLQQSPERAWDALALATSADIATAPHRIYRGADALSITTQAGAAAAKAEVPALSISTTAQAGAWLDWLDERPHLLLAAASGAGKSVLANVVIARQAQRPGTTVAILDRHWSPMVESDEGRLVPKWGGIAPLAVAYADIRGALMALRGEYDRRMAQLNAGEVREGRFPPILVVIDEVPEVMREVRKLDPKGMDTWADAVVVLGSGGRKVNMHGRLLTQSPLVEDIGMNSAMRKNFYRVALAQPECRALLKEEPDTARRAALTEALRGQRFPAAVERNGEVWLLDRSELLELMPDRIDAPAWEPDGRCPSVSADASSAALQAILAADRPRQTEPVIDTVALLRALRRQGKSRETARELLHAHGVQFDNGLWTAAGEGL